MSSYVRRTKTYIAFDGDADLMCYRTIQSWSADPKYPFHLNDAHEINYARDDSLPESIISQLRERMDASKNVVLIIGSQTNRNRKGILQWEIGYAVRHGLPIILAFKGYSADTLATEELWQTCLLPLIPKTLRDRANDAYCLVSPLTRNAVCSAIHKYSNTDLPSQGYTWYWH